MRIMRENANTRVLVIDDEEVIRSSIAEILNPPAARDFSQLEQSAGLLFGDSPAGPNNSQAAPAHKSGNFVKFRLDVAHTGKEGFNKVRNALENEDPYAVIFLDMRMPGWDGLRTAEEIRKYDERVEILFITAYSDHDLDDIIRHLGHDVGYFCKPFATEEIRQMALKGVFDWNRLDELEDLLSVVSSLNMNISQANVMLSGILQQVLGWTGGVVAFMLTRSTAGELYDVLEPESRHFKTVLNNENFTEADLIHCMQSANRQSFTRRGSLLVLPLDQYVMVIEISVDAIIPPSRRYLLRLFLQHASKVLENAALRREVQIKERLSVLGAGISEVAHDLRCPTLLVQQLLEFAEEHIDDADQLKELLDMAKGTAARANAYVEDILNFTKGATLDKKQVSLSKVLGDLVHQFQFMGRLSGVEVKLDVSGPIQLVCDGSKLERAVSNLIQNALEALEHNRTSDPVITVKLDQDDTAVYLDISDNGPGLPEKVRPMLFEPFCSFGKTQGTGLGLAICRQVVESHGGKISAPACKAGTLFSIIIPKNYAQGMSPEN